MRLWTSIVRWRGRGSTHAPAPQVPANLASPERFRALVDRERQRVDRNGSRFSLLVLTPRHARGDCPSFCIGKNGTVPAHAADAVFAALADFLAFRLRVTDDVGWWRPGALGVLLPDTPAQGAGKVADDICRAECLPGPVDCEIYVYPSHRRPPSDADRAELGEDAEIPAAARPLEPALVQALPAWKRAFDVVGAVIALVLLAPIMLLAALAIKSTSRGPVFFRQLRDGLGGRRFWVYKFRTMIVDAEKRKQALRAFSEQDGPAFKLARDPRVTPVGRFLRKTCIDELPQLWNVLRGQMSLVGPRPMDSKESQHCRGWERRRLDVTPGLTCIWQVDGGARVPFAEWMRMDIRYIRRRTVWHDVKLLLKTVIAVLSCRASN
jgi:lipopolysaccharide/colanic/teichoic acid biosynthesis glycosyltransferase